MLEPVTLTNFNPGLERDLIALPSSGNSGALSSDPLNLIDISLNLTRNPSRSSLPFAQVYGNDQECKPLYGTDENDILSAVPARGNIYGLDGNDFIFGNSNKDVLFGNNGSDLIWGNGNDDILNGGRARDYLLGEHGNDFLVGGADDDLLRGGKGSDRLKGGAGNDLLWGDGSNDQLDGGTGNDSLQGDQGDDILADYDGGDRLTGGKGADHFWIGDPESYTPTIITDFQVETDKLQLLSLGASFDTLTIEDSSDGAELLEQGKAIAVLEGVKAASLKQDSLIFGNAQLADDLQQDFNQVLQQANVPGAAMAVIAPDGTTWLGSGGFSNLDTEALVRPGDRFGIASITKPIVATTVLQLVEEQKLNLEDTLSNWLPDTASRIPNGDRITIRQLLNMTSGIPDYSRVIEEAVIKDPSILERQWTPQELVSLIDNQPALFEPGQQFDYSNTNYLLLGEIIEKVTGSTLASQMQQRIFEPLGMDNTFYAPQEEIPGGAVRSYFDFNGDGQFEDTNENLSAGAGAGGIVSTAADVTRFAQGLFKGELLAPNTLQQMLSDGMSVDGLTYGLGVFSGNTPDGDRFWAHDGSSFGLSAWMVYLPERDITVVALTNRGTTEEDVNNNPFSSPQANPAFARLAGPALPLAFQAIENIARQYSTQDS